MTGSLGRQRVAREDLGWGGVAFESRLKGGGGAARHEAEKTFQAKGTAGGGVCLVAVLGSPPQSHL